MKLPKHTRKQYLSTWLLLNDVIKHADEQLCKQLMEDEQADKKRPTFIARIHSRMNKVRADRERAELKAKSK